MPLEEGTTEVMTAKASNSSTWPVAISSPSTKKARLSPTSTNSHSAGSSDDKISLVGQQDGSANRNGRAADGLPMDQEDEDGQEHVIDESFYSRQLYVMGTDAMTRMANTKVLISGLGGLGVEVAKSVILGGVKSLTLLDTKLAEWRDLSSQYYLTEGDIGSNRATVSFNHLARLNPYVTVEVSTNPLTTEEVSGHNVLVLTEYDSTEQILQLSDFCHTNNIAFILCQTNGLFGRVFCDFGEEFVVVDSTGEQPLSALVKIITKETQGVVTCLDKHPHEFNDGDYVRFREVLGMTEINGLDPVKVKVTGPYTFRIDMDTSGFSDYISNGTVTQVKMQQKVSFKPYRESEQSPEFRFCDDEDVGKDDHPETLHTAYSALNQFIAEQKRYPRPWNQEDANAIIELAEKLKGADVELITDLVKVFSFVCSGNLAPINAVIGGTAAQEVMKACTGKFTPICQWMYYDAVECLPDPFPCPRHTVDYEPVGNRYDGQTAVFGKAFQDQLLEQRWFVVGSGGIGCEHLKNFAMMGVGNVVVTDMDFIERSNLNRQFLFRPENVGQNKAVAAKAAIQLMNPGIKVEAHENRVGPETENVYGDDFFESLNGVADALDNMETRFYMDSRCVYYRKPLLESGTNGTRGNALVVIPFLTESFASPKYSKPSEKEIANCTLRHFPYAIEHTLQWARDLFEGLFRQPLENAASFLKDQRFLEKALQLPGSQQLDTVESLYKVLVEERPLNFEDCVKWARVLWEDNFGSQIKQLLYNFPADIETSTGNLFWQSPKRCPHPLVFGLENELAIDFVFTAANLRADVFQIQRQSRDSVEKIVLNVEVPEFVPKSGVRIATSDSDAEAQNMANKCSVDQSRIDKLVDLIRGLDQSGLKINPLEFEKDDDKNLHIDFIVACSNSRASNYDIEHADRLKSKLIAGKIMPAIVTTTSVIAGLVAVELYKVVQGHANIEKYKNELFNLASPHFAFFTPLACDKKTYHESEWTLWDRFDVEGEMTLQGFMDFFENEHQLQVTMISQGAYLLYSFFMPPDQAEKRLALPVTEVVRHVSRRSIEPHVRALVFELCCNDREGKDVDIPYVRYVIPLNQRQQ